MPIIYCVEDDESIRELIVYALNNNNLKAKSFENWSELSKEMEEEIPDLILLDIMLPGDDGYRILDKLRSDFKTKDIPVIMISAKTSEYDKVKGLDMGADDYITKPFGVMELISRINAVLRRSNRRKSSENILSLGSLVLDIDKRIVTVDSREVNLTYKEFELLYYLLLNKDVVLSRNKLMLEVWGTDFEGESRTVIIEPIKLTTQNIESILSGEKVEIPEVYEELKPFIETIELQKKEIEAYIRKLKEAEKIRREFTANVSHELKTPLTSINGFAEMIETGTAKGEDAMKSAAIIRKEGNRLLDLIDSIIKLSQLEDINVEKEFAPLDIYPVGETVLTNLRPKAKEKNISLSLHGSKTVVEANRRMIEDLLYNLIDNAINYNKPGGEVSINIYPKGDWAVIRVSDTGIGIPVEDQSRIFERFYRVDKSRSKKVGGTGLGLSIVKHIVEFHNGKIDLSSKVGEGTTIEVHLPK